MSKVTSMSFRCVDFQTSDIKDEDFSIKMYGIDEKRNTYCVEVDDFKPFFYIKVGPHWNNSDIDNFMDHLKNYGQN